MPRYVLINRSDNSFHSYSDTIASVEPDVTAIMPFTEGQDPETSGLAYYQGLLATYTPTRNTNDKLTKDTPIISNESETNIGNKSSTIRMGIANIDNGTYDLFTGQTASGKVKNINIGTGGVAGSTTNIAIGSGLTGGLLTIYQNINSLGGLTLPTGTATRAPLNIGAFGVTKTTPIDGDIWKSAVDNLTVRMSTNTRTIAFLEKSQSFSGTQTFSTVSATTVTSTGTVTGRQFAGTVTAQATAATHTFALSSGSRLNITGTITVSPTVTITSQAVGTEATITGLMGATPQNITLSSTGVVFKITKSTTTGTASVVIPSSLFPASSFFSIRLIFTATLECFVSVV